MTSAPAIRTDGPSWLRVSEVTGLTVDSVDFDAGTVKVIGKGRETRTVYLTESSAGTLRQWLDVRESVADPGESALFIALDRAHKGSGTSARAIRYAVDSYLADAGLRVSEAVNLKADDVYLASGRWYLHVRGKGGKSREVEVSEDLGGERNE